MAASATPASRLVSAPDVVILAQGVLNGSGVASIRVVPPFNGTVLDRYYLQAVTSPAPNFVPLEASPGRAVRNGDLIAGLAGAEATGPSGSGWSRGGARCNGTSGAGRSDGLTGPAGATSVRSGHGPP